MTTKNLQTMKKAKTKFKETMQCQVTDIGNNKWWSISVDLEIKSYSKTCSAAYLGAFLWKLLITFNWSLKKTPMSETVF